MTITATLAGAISMLAQFGLFFGGGNNRNNPLGGIGALLMVFLAPLAAALVQMAVSRTREYEADKDGADDFGRADGAGLGAAARSRSIAQRTDQCPRPSAIRRWRISTSPTRSAGRAWTICSRPTRRSKTVSRRCSRSRPRWAATARGYRAAPRPDFTDAQQGNSGWRVPQFAKATIAGRAAPGAEFAETETGAGADAPARRRREAERRAQGGELLAPFAYGAAPMAATGRWPTG